VFCLVYFGLVVRFLVFVFGVVALVCRYRVQGIGWKDPSKETLSQNDQPSVEWDVYVIVGDFINATTCSVNLPQALMCALVILCCKLKHDS